MDFICHKEIKDDDITVDVRTKEEYLHMPLFRYNLPIINKKQHDFLKKIPILSIPIVTYGFIRNSELLKKELLSLSNNKQNAIIVGCNRGRLRSPFIYYYAKILGIECKILKFGIKSFYDKENMTPYDYLKSYFQL